MTSESTLTVLHCANGNTRAPSQSPTRRTGESMCSVDSPVVDVNKGETNLSTLDAALANLRSRLPSYKWSQGQVKQSSSESTGRSKDSSVTTASLILPSATSLLSQPIFVAIKTSPLILVPCSFDSSTGCLSIAPSFNPQLLNSCVDTSALSSLPGNETAGNIISLNNATIVNSNGTSHHLSDHSRSNSPVCVGVHRKQLNTSRPVDCNKLITSRPKLSPNNGKVSTVNGDSNNVSIAQNSSHTDTTTGTSIQSAAAVLAAFASSSSSSSSSSTSSTACNNHEIPNDLKEQLPHSGESNAGTSTLPLDLSSRSIINSSSNLNQHNSLAYLVKNCVNSTVDSYINSFAPANLHSVENSVDASIKSNINSYINSLTAGNNLHNVSALIQAMIANSHCNTGTPVNGQSIASNISTLAALQAALQATECTDTNCNCKSSLLSCSSDASKSVTSDSTPSNSGNPGHIKRRRASNAIIIAPGSSNFLSKPLHSDLESSSPSPQTCVSPAPTTSASSTGPSTTGNSVSVAPSLLLPTNDLNQLLAAAVAQQQQQQRSVNCVINNNTVTPTSTATAIAPVVVNGTTAGSGGLETTAVKQGTHRCEDCNIVFYRQENYLVHKANYCASRRGSGGNLSDRSNHKDHLGTKCNGLSSTSSSPTSSSSSSTVTMSVNNLCKSTQSNEISTGNSHRSLNHEQVHRSSSQMSSGAESTDHAPSSSPEVSQDAINPMSLGTSVNGTSVVSSVPLTVTSRSINSSSPSPPPLPPPLPSATSTLVAPGTSSSSAISTATANASLAASIAVNGSIVQYFCVTCGIRFTSLDTLQAHQTFYCLKRSSIAAVAAAAAAAAANNAAAAAAIASSSSSSSSSASPKLSNVDCKSESADGITDHHSLAHAVVNKNNGSEQQRSTASASTSNQQSFKCTICGYKGHTIRGMRTHVRMHSDQLLPGTCEETFIQSMDPSIDISTLTANAGGHSNSKMNSRRRTAAAALNASSNGKRKKTIPFLRC